MVSETPPPELCQPGRGAASGNPGSVPGCRRHTLPQGVVWPRDPMFKVTSPAGLLATILGCSDVNELGVVVELADLEDLLLGVHIARVR